MTKSKIFITALLLASAGSLHAQSALNPATIGSLTGIVSVFMGCLLAICIVASQLYFRHRRDEQLHQTVRAMVEKGVPIPPELLKPEEQRKDASSRKVKDLRIGLALIGLGLGTCICYGKIGAIPLLMGLGFVIASALQKRDVPQVPKLVS